MRRSLLPFLAIAAMTAPALSQDAVPGSNPIIRDKFTADGRWRPPLPLCRP